MFRMTISISTSISIFVHFLFTMATIIYLSSLVTRMSFIMGLNNNKQTTGKDYRACKQKPTNQSFMFNVCCSQTWIVIVLAPFDCMMTMVHGQQLVINFLTFIGDDCNGMIVCFAEHQHCFVCCSTKCRISNQHKACAYYVSMNFVWSDGSISIKVDLFLHFYSCC